MSTNERLELRDFISETIKQVVDGVVAAQKYAGDKDAVVNPSLGFHNQGQSVAIDKDTQQPVQSISFDIAVTAAKGTKTQGGIAVFTGMIGLGSQGKSEKSNQSVNRIQFSLPISLPVGKRERMAFRHVD